MGTPTEVKGCAPLDIVTEIEDGYRTGASTQVKLSQLSHMVHSTNSKILLRTEPLSTEFQ